MRQRFGAVAGFFLAVSIGLFLTMNLGAQEKKPKLTNIQGKVQSVKKDTSTITVNTGKVTREVMFASDTKFVFGHSKDNKPGSLDQVKDGNFISCAGEMHGSSLMAKECVYRAEK